jgi:hypothetical protein
MRVPTISALFRRFSSGSSRLREELLAGYAPPMVQGIPPAMPVAPGNADPELEHASDEALASLAEAAATSERGSTYVAVAGPDFDEVEEEDGVDAPVVILPLTI